MTPKEKLLDKIELESGKMYEEKRDVVERTEPGGCI